MPINIFGGSENNSNNNNIDTSLFIQKPYLRTNCIESNIEEDIDMKTQFRVINLPYPTLDGDGVCKAYVDILFNDPSIIKNNTHVNFNDKNLDNVRFIKVNSLPAVREHLTPKAYVDDAIRNSIDESSLSRLDPEEKLNLDEQDSIILNSSLTSPITKIELPTKSYIDSLHEENERNRRDLGLDFYNESNTLLKFNQTLQNYLKVSVGNDTYNLTKYDKIQLIDYTEIRSPNIGLNLLPKWRIKNLNKNNGSKLGNFLKSTITSSPSSLTGATSLPPIGVAFMYIETSNNNHGSNVFVSFERTDIIQISNITFYYNRFSDHNPSMGRFRIQLLLEDNTWSTIYTIEKNTNYSDNPTDWELLNLDITQSNYGVKFIYDQIDTAHADMCFSNITITHSVY